MPDGHVMKETTMRKTGRNDPCPCGSGKKYKSCCQHQPVARPADFLWRQLRRVDDQLTHALLKHAKRLYGYEGLEAAWEAYAGGDLDAFDIDSPHNQAFFPWYLYNWRADAAAVEDDGSDTPTIAESYLERSSKRVSEMERRLIALIADQPFSFHEVVACEPGKGYRLKDLLLEHAVEVIEHSGSQLCKPGDIIFGRVIQYDHVGLLMGCGSILMPPASKPSIMQLRRLMGGQKAGLSARDVHAWERDIRQLYFDIEARLHRPPDLRNTEGDPLSLHELYFEIDSPGYAFDGLKGLAWPIEEAELLHEAELDARGQVRAIEFPWLQRGNAKVGALEHTVVGHIRIEGRELVALVNSHNRAKRIRAEIERRLTHHVRYKATDMQSMRSIQRAYQRTPRRQDEDERTGVNVPPEVQQHVEQMLDAHWRNWVHMAIPALGDRTPLEAVKEAEGREMVRALLDDMERREQHLGMGIKQQAYIDRAREQLGLQS
jgi:SEC-C motif/Antitoxin Xre/MbcA/ParS C-terminal toxin-binding domain